MKDFLCCSKRVYTVLNLCLYSTVYNNVQYVERSISSVWRPDAEIVIVDSFSTDGTYEKLLSLKKTLI